jgi:hypothetical protein
MTRKRRLDIRWPPCNGQFYLPDRLIPGVTMLAEKVSVNSFGL